MKHRLSNPAPRPWWAGNALSDQVRGSFRDRALRPGEWEGNAWEARQEIVAGADYAGDVRQLVFAPTVCEYLTAAGWSFTTSIVGRRHGHLVHGSVVCASASPAANLRAALDLTRSWQQEAVGTQREAA